MELYVSNKAINGDGSFEKPFSTLESARDYLRKNKPSEDVNINIIEGRYQIKQSFKLDERDILPNGHKTVYKAYKNAEVILDGGVVIPYSDVKKTVDEDILSRIIDKDAREHIYEVDLSKYDIELVSYGDRGKYVAYRPSNNELFIDLKPQTIAKYPNNGYVSMNEVIDSGSKPFFSDFSDRGGVFRYEDERCDLWGKADDMYVRGIFNWVFAENTLRVSELDTKNRTITTEHPVLPGFEAHGYTKWYALNLLEEIDVPGEYYVDVKNKKLYFYPSQLSESSLIQISSLGDAMIAIQNCENVEFNGIIMENSRGTAVCISNGHDCVINNCIMRNLGMIGVQIGKGTIDLPDGLHDGHGVLAEGVPQMTPQTNKLGSFEVYCFYNAGLDFEGGKNNGIINSEIYSTGMGGVFLLGGNRKKLEPANNYVKNSKIHDVSRIEDHAAINMFGVGNIISHCEIFDISNQAIWFQGNDHLIEYNNIYDAMKHCSDGGVIYIGRDISAVGNKINSNFIHDCFGGIGDENGSGICAIYFDDYCCFNEVHGNYFYNIKQHNDTGVFSTILWNRGGQTSVANNIFIDCSIPIRPMMNGFMGIHKILKNPDDVLTIRALAKENNMRGVDITSPVYREKYPYLNEVYEGTYQNQILLWNNVTVMNDLSGFVDAPNRNFTVKEDNIMVRNYETVDIYDFLAGVDGENRKIEITDFSKIGIISY